MHFLKCLKGSDIDRTARSAIEMILDIGHALFNLTVCLANGGWWEENRLSFKESETGPHQLELQ